MACDQRNGNSACDCSSIEAPHETQGYGLKPQLKMLAHYVPFFPVVSCRNLVPQDYIHATAVLCFAIVVWQMYVSCRPATI